MTKFQAIGWMRRGGPINYKVFGIGMIKTGTTTLGACMRRLGYRHATHRRDLLELWEKGEIEPLLRVADDNDSFDDFPWLLIYRELYERYGDKARFVLTTRRDSRTWLESLKKHSLTTNPVRAARSIAFGFDYPHGLESEHIEIYEKHNREVRDFFSDKPGLLLEICWEEGHGWRELSPFLGHRIPWSPLPHKNRGSDKPVDAKILAANKARVALQTGQSAGSRPG